MVAFLLSLTLGCRNKTEIPFDSNGDSSGDCVAAAEVCDDVDNDCDGLVDDQDPDLTGALTWYGDADGDGFGGVDGATPACVAPVGFVSDATDCDDARPDVYPGADEICDGLDNDCDDLIDGQDDSLVGAPSWYQDSDGDGYGGESTDDRACEAPVGQVADGADCDDGDPDVNPAADEVCDDRDNDCDGLVDGQDDSLTDGTTWYADDDGDGFGDARDAALACSAPPGRVANDADCDDANSGSVRCAAAIVMSYTCVDPHMIGDPAYAVAELEAVTVAASDLGLDLDVYWEDSTGLDPAVDLTTYQLVMETSCGIQWKSYNAQTLRALIAARDAGVSVFLFGDDVANNDGLPGVDELLITGEWSSNGGSGTVVIGTDTGAPVTGSWGTATGYSYSADIDTVSAAGNGERNLATIAATDRPVWTVFEDSSTGQRSAALVASLYSCDHGVVGDASDLAALGVIFRNTLEWLVP